MATGKVDASKFSLQYSYLCYRHIFISCKSLEIVRAHYTLLLRPRSACPVQIRAHHHIDVYADIN